VGDLRAAPPGGRAPGLVFTGPFTGVRDQVTGLYAERLAAAGYVSWRSTTATSASRAAIRAATRIRRASSPTCGPPCHSCAPARRSTPGAAGPSGSAWAGGYALKFAAFDPRVKVFAGIAGAYNTPYAMRSGMGADRYGQVLASFTAVAEDRDRGGEVQYLPAGAAQGEAAMPGEEPFAYYGTGRGASAYWENSVTRASVRELLTVDNMSGADFRSATPGLVVHGVQDADCSPEGAREAHERIGGPKRIVWLDATRHIDLYDTEPYVTQAVEAVTAFLSEHL
jgi:pimeloyl-ACP methyl ester carboxylesterase